MEIYELLKKDHDKVLKLLQSIEEKKDRSLFSNLKKEVIIHSEAEEEAYYEPLQSIAGKLKIMIKAGHEEHDLVMKMMKQLDKIEDEEEWMSLFSVVKQSLEAHIKMEEKDLFDLGRKHFKLEEAKAMAEDMNKLKAKLEKNYKE
jgi:hypothetical protein